MKLAATISFRGVSPNEIHTKKDILTSYFNRTSPEPPIVRFGVIVHGKDSGRCLEVYGIVPEQYLLGACSAVGIPKKNVRFQHESEKPETIDDVVAERKTENVAEVVPIAQIPVIVPQKKTRGHYRPRVSYGEILPHMLNVLRDAKPHIVTVEDMRDLLRLDGYDLGEPTVRRRMNSLVATSLASKEGNGYMHR